MGWFSSPESLSGGLWPAWIDVSIDAPVRPQTLLRRRRAAPLLPLLLVLAKPASRLVLLDLCAGS